MMPLINFQIKKKLESKHQFVYIYEIFKTTLPGIMIETTAIKSVIDDLFRL